VGKGCTSTRIVSISLSGLLGLGVYWLIRISIKALVSAHP
jgi:hypothetical protein